MLAGATCRCRVKTDKIAQKRFSKSLAEESVVRSAIAPLAELSSAVETGCAAAVVLVLDLPSSGDAVFFLRPNETPKLLAKLANVPLAVGPVEVAANGDVRGV